MTMGCVLRTGGDALSVCLQAYDSHPYATYCFFIEEMNKRGIAYIHMIEPRAKGKEGAASPVAEFANEHRDETLDVRPRSNKLCTGLLLASAFSASGVQGESVQSSAPEGVPLYSRLHELRNRQGLTGSVLSCAGVPQGLAGRVHRGGVRLCYLRIVPASHGFVHSARKVHKTNRLACGIGVHRLASLSALRCKTLGLPFGLEIIRFVGTEAACPCFALPIAMLPTQ